MLMTMTTMTRAEEQYWRRSDAQKRAWIRRRDRGVAQSHKLCACGHASYEVATSCCVCGASLRTTKLTRGSARATNETRALAIAIRTRSVTS